MKNKIMNAIVLIELLIIIGLTIYIFVDVKNDKKEKNFSLKTNEIVLEVNKEYNLLDYIELKNIKLSDLNIIYDEEYILIKNNKLLVKNDINETKINFSYKDIEYELIINVKNDLGKCHFKYEDISSMNGNIERIFPNQLDGCETSATVHYGENLKLLFFQMDTFSETMESYLKVFIDDKLVLEKIGCFNIVSVKNMGNLYLISYAGAVASLDSQVDILLNEDGVLIDEYIFGNDADFKSVSGPYGSDSGIIEFDYKNNKIVATKGGGPNYCVFVEDGIGQIKKTYEYKNNSIVLIEKQEILKSELCK